MFNGKYPTALLYILAAAFVVRIALFFVLLERHDDVHSFYLPDTIGYMQIADNLVAGNGYSMATTTPYIADGNRVPVLPLSLALTKKMFGTPVPFVLFQIGLSVLIIVLVHRLTRLVTESETLALIAAGFAAFEPYSVFINFSLLTETAFSVIMLAGIYAACLYVRDGAVRFMAIASAFFGLAAITRPIAQFTFILLMILVLYRSSWQRYVLSIACAVIPFFLVASPWLIHNYQTFGTVSFSSNGYQNVYSDLGATIISYRDGVEWYVAKDNLNADFAARHAIPVDDLQKDPKWNTVFLREGIGIMIANPVPTITAFASVGFAFFTNDIWTYYPQRWGWMKSFVYGFSPTHTLMSEGPIAAARGVFAATDSRLLIPVVGRLFWVGISALFFVGSLIMCMRGGEKRMYAIFFLTITLYMVALVLSAGAGVNGRYRYPINAILYVPALYAVRGIFRRTVVLLRRTETP